VIGCNAQNSNGVGERLAHRVRGKRHYQEDVPAARVAEYFMGVIWPHDNDLWCKYSWLGKNKQMLAFEKLPVCFKKI